MKPASSDHPVIRDPADFDRRSGSLVEQLLFNHRLVVVALCALLTLFLGWQATRITLNANFEKMVPTRHPFIVNYLANRADLSGLGNTLQVAVENTQGDIVDARYLETLRKLNDELFLLPGVDRPYMKSLWTPSTRWLGVTEDGLEGGPVIPDDYDGSTVSLQALRANIARSGQVGLLVAADFRSSLIRVPMLDKDPAGKRLDYGAFSAELEKLRDKYSAPGIRIHITGFAKIVGDLIEGLRQVLLFLGLAIAICAVVLYAYTRCIRSTLLLLACSSIAVVWLLGLLPLLGYELDPYSILVPFLVFAIGMSHGAQKMNGIMQDVGRGTHRWIAARYTFRRLFVAGLTALIADAVGFGVLMVIEVPVIRELAITASLGMAVLIFTNLVLLPILLSYVGVSPAAAARSVREETARASDSAARSNPAWTFLGRFTQRRGATAAVLVAGVLAACGFVVSEHLKIGDLQPGAPELRADSRYNRDAAFMVAHYAASNDTYVVMVKTPQFQCANYETLAKVQSLEEELQQLPGVVSTNSLADLATNTAVGMNEGSLKWYGLPRTQDMLNVITSRAPRELFNPNCDLLTLYVYLRSHEADTLASVVDVVQGFARRHDSDQARFLSAAGNAGIEAATNIVVRQANHRMLILVYLAVIVLAFITFRSWRAVLCAVLPLMLTTVLAESLMVALGIGMKVAMLPVIALGVGIGVDYSLYVLSVTLAELRQGQSLAVAYHRALLFTGRVVVLTGVTLGVAVATWAFSPIKFQADMGMLLAFMFVLNMLGALILLPALGHFLLEKPSAAPDSRPQTRAASTQHRGDPAKAT
jgi:uncharacterized protein